MSTLRGGGGTKIRMQLCSYRIHAAIPVMGREGVHEGVAIAFSVQFNLAR